jgi:hypothetical protein
MILFGNIEVYFCWLIFRSPSLVQQPQKVDFVSVYVTHGEIVYLNEYIIITKKKTNKKPYNLFVGKNDLQKIKAK